MDGDSPRIRCLVVATLAAHAGEPPAGDHFALNCAAASCPPIGAYDPSRLDAQLDLATSGYLAEAVRREGPRLLVPRLFLWFMGDFGGPRGVRRFLERHGVETARAHLSFARHDWSLRPAAWSGPVADADEAASSVTRRPGSSVGQD